MKFRMDHRIILISVIMYLVSADDNNDISVPVVKREISFGTATERSCATKEYIDELFPNIANAVEKITCICESKAGILELKNDLSAVKADTGELKNDQSAVKSDIEELKSALSTVKTDIGELKNDLSAVKADIEELKSDISVVMEQIEEKKSQDCEDIQNKGNLDTGIYTIYPFQRNNGIQVRCDMTTTYGGWTVIQRRISDSDFYKKWQAYEEGFGSLSGNFWLGLKNIHMLTRQDRYTLRVDLTSMDGRTAYAEYREFTIGDARTGYTLFVDGYKGTAGDSLNTHGNGMKFSTKDRDNDIYSGNCAVSYHGAWWYKKCHQSNLNGDYGNSQYAKGPVWASWKGYYSPMKVTEMKIRRIT